MATPICYIPNGKIDGGIASKLGWKSGMKSTGWNPAKIASYRGLYEAAKGEELISSDNPTNEELEEAAKKILKFRAEIGKMNSIRISSGTKRMAQAYDKLRHAFNAQNRQRRINLISALFSEEVDRLTEGNDVDRQAVVNGFETQDGYFVGGEVAILESVYNGIHQLRAENYRASKNPEKAFEAKLARGGLNYANAPSNVQEFQEYATHCYEEYTKMIECWEELIPFVLKDLVKKEGVKLGVKREYAALASTDNFGANDIAAKWEISEAKKDGWMENSDLQSAFASVGQQVRRILATVPSVYSKPIFKPDEYGVERYRGIEILPVKDDLGNPVFIDPVEAHQKLQEFLRGIKDSEDMMKRFCANGKVSEGVARIPWMQPIVDLLVSDPALVTKFFCDFKKNFQPYSVMFEDPKTSTSWIKKFKTRILNRPTNVLIGRYNMSMTSKGKHPANTNVWMTEPVFGEGANGKGGLVNWERLAELRKEVLAWTKETKVEMEGPGGTKVYGISTAPLLTRDQNAEITINGVTKRITYDMKRKFLMDVFSSLGYDVNADTVDQILHSKDIYSVREQLEDLFDRNGNTGILYMLSGEAKDFRTISNASSTKKAKQEALDRLNSKELQFKNLYRREARDAEGKAFAPIKEHSEKLLDIINKYQDGYRIESRCRFQGNTMYSFVAPSYLGDRLEDIEGFVKRDDKEGLKKYLKDRYLKSYYFVDDDYLRTDGKEGKILNMWLEELMDACDSKVPLADSVAAIFSFERDLGRQDKKFEDFTEKEHGIDMLIHFFADEQQKKGYGGKGTRDVDKKLSAMYPVFILGDSGVSKYIRAPRITSAVKLNKEGGHAKEGEKVAKIGYEFDSVAKEKVLNGFWNIYLQERRRMAVDKAIALEMYANGKEVKHSDGEFSILTFLNPTSQEYSEKYAIPAGKEDDEDTVKRIIATYLHDAAIEGVVHHDGSRKITIPSFKTRLENLGVLELSDEKEGQDNQKKKGKGIYRNISTIANPSNIDQKIEEFFWNTKLATAQQLQLMTIDPIFYSNTKDLQKRYKEIHAPGNVLDVRARDFYGEPYCPNFNEDGEPVERMAYFKELKTNAEEHNPEFMEMALRTFHDPNVPISDVEKAIKEGILVPKKTKEEESARQKKLLDLLGDRGYKIYHTYTENSLTDGQGYRTLTSYRRVMGMAGKWTRDMENAYNDIMEIRRNHAVYGPDGRTIVDYTEITPEELKRIASYALVFQPIKPYMFTHEKYKVTLTMTDKAGNPIMDGAGNPVTQESFKLIPVQHKYAEAVIIPELMPKGHKLRDMGFWMDENNIDLVGTDKIAKVGCFGQANLAGVKDINDLRGRMKQAYVHELPYRDYRIQTNVPEHINGSQLFGTQLRKLIMAGLRMNDKDYYSSYIGGRETVNLGLSKDGNTPQDMVKLNGRNLLALYNSLICENIFDSYKTFAENADDIEELSNLLQQCTVSSMRESMDNLLSYIVTGDEEALQRFMVPLFEGGLEHDTAALILSTFKKIVNKQQISGGSAVQVSAFGIDGYERDGGLRFVADPDNPANILHAEIEMPFDKHYTIKVKTADGREVKQEVEIPYDKYCNPDGTMIPLEQPLQRGDAEWKKYLSYTYKRVNGKLVPCKHDDPEAEVHKPLIEQDYPGILNVMAVRIPTEKDYSMMNCMVKRFTLKLAGGTLKCPPQGTGIASFDFDIDKLYFMVKEFHKHFNDDTYVESKFDDADKYAIWGKIYKDNENVRMALDREREKAIAKNPNLVKEEPLFINGVKTQFTKKTKPALNKFWDEAKIEERFGLNKREVFAKTAQEMGIKPKKVEKGERTEWLEEYDFDQPPSKNSRASRNNLLMQLIIARLQDPETVKERYTPGGFDNSKASARLMRELFHGNLDGIVSNGIVDMKALESRTDEKTDPEPNYDPTNPYTILLYNQQNQVAGKLIGIFANQNTNHAFASLMDVFELNDSISFCGKSFKDLLHKDPDEAYRIGVNMAEFLAASVDAVKDPVLNFLNLNTITADAGALLARLGYSTKEIGLLFNQPIIRKACVESFNRGANIHTVIKDLRRKYAKEAGYSDRTKRDISENELALNIITEREMLESKKTQDDFLKNYAGTQMAVLDLFEDILKTSEDVSDFVLNTKFTASNAVSSTFGGMYAQQLRVNEYVSKFPQGNDKGKLRYKVTVSALGEGTGMFDKPIDNNPELVTMKSNEYLRRMKYNPFAYEQAMYDANRKAIKLLSKYFPYETAMYKDIRNTLNGLSRFGTLSEDDINDIHSNIPVAMLAKQQGSLFDGEAVHVINGEPTNLTNREYYRQKFAKDLSEMLAKDKKLDSLTIFQYLFPESYDIKGPNGEIKPDEAWKISIQDAGGMDPEIKDAIRDSWTYLIDNEDDNTGKYRQLGIDLFMYCFYQLGFDYSPLSFMHLAPTSVKTAVTVRRGSSIPINSFTEIKPSTSTEKSDDVLVWSACVPGGREKAMDSFNGGLVEAEVFTGDAYQLPDKLSYNAFRKLIEVARRFPERKFKIDRTISQKDFDLLNAAQLGEDIPSNIYFNKDTLSSVDNIDQISYGRERTYVEFLNDILEGRERSLSPDEFAQMFILNHLDNPKFVMDTDKCSSRLKEIIKEQLKADDNTIMNGAKYRETIILTADGYSDKASKDALSDLVSFEIDGEGALISASWCPCIKIGDSYYLAESGTNFGFNVNRSTSMVYRKMVPWGSSKTMYYDHGETFLPAMTYKTSMRAVESRNSNYVEPIDDNTPPPSGNGTSPEPLTGEGNGEALPTELIDRYTQIVFNAYVEAATNAGTPMMAEEKEGIMSKLKAAKEEDIEDTALEIRREYKAGKVPVLEDGQPVFKKPILNDEGQITEFC